MLLQNPLGLDLDERILGEFSVCMASDRRQQVVEAASRGRMVLVDNRDAALAIAVDLRDRLGERDLERLLDLLEPLAEVGPC